MTAKTPSSSNVLWFWADDLEKAQRKRIEQTIKLLKMVSQGKAFKQPRKEFSGAVSWFQRCSAVEDRGQSIPVFALQSVICQYLITQF